jgi:citrate lyase subunit gamma (acyl carrier protein)
MEIIRKAIAGSVESSDVLVEVSPGGGIEIELASIVMNQFGERIRAVIAETLRDMGIGNAHISADDHGALDCVIRARLETALRRAAVPAEETL